ncbi:hypothetical protein [Lysinibacter sp. HNR]|uniref:hypothetical protein n=1 Tax=Lysinibacter sp. HNR TaxID=3031408 RepID=UPI002435699E|nr:hypothetical protein [Lysinibacter sp. HNR]WGD36952.1 hypothetical protein FrondiHNR_10935 [Lysinibacter sp. HNR]
MGNSTYRNYLIALTRDAFWLSDPASVMKEYVLTWKEYDGASARVVDYVLSSTRISESLVRSMVESVLRRAWGVDSMEAAEFISRILWSGFSR